MVSCLERPGLGWAFFSFSYRPSQHIAAHINLLCVSVYLPYIWVYQNNTTMKTYQVITYYNSGQLAVKISSNSDIDSWRQIKLFVELNLHDYGIPINIEINELQ